MARRPATTAALDIGSLRANAHGQRVILDRAFVRLRAEFARHHDLVKRLAEIERTLIGHDGALRDLYARVRPLLLAPPAAARRRVGCLTKEAAARYRRRRVRGA